VENQHDDSKQSEGAQDNTAAPNGQTPGSARGKAVVGLVILVVVIVGAYYVTRRSSLVATGGAPATAAAITLVTSDRADLDCAAASAIQGFRCGFANETTAAQGDEQNKLKPYYTLDRHLYLIPGLFLEPAVAKRYQSELPNKPREQLKRFTANCQLKVVGKLSGVRLRWLATGTWSNPEDADVATIASCKIEG